MRCSWETSVTFFYHSVRLPSREVKSLRIVNFRRWSSQGRMGEGIYIYIYIPIIYSFWERSTREGMAVWLADVNGACRICSERVGRPLTAPGAGGTRGQGGLNRRRPGMVRWALCQPFQLHISWRLALYAPKTCWVAGLYVNFTRDLTPRILQPLPQRSRFHPGEKWFKTCCPRASPEAWLYLWSALDLLISARVFSTFPVSQEPVFAEIFLKSIPKKCEILLHFFTQYGEDQIFFSNLWRYW